MKDSQLQRLLSLLRRSGGHSIIADPASDALFVLMEAEEYEKFLPPPAAAMPGREYSAPEPLSMEDSDENEDPFAVDLNDSSSEEIQNQAEEINPQFERPSGLEFASDWLGFRPSPILVEETLADVPHEEIEEQFYLEQVE